ncbi:metallophosphoesterase [Spirochaeta isovalerica]|uniref:UDP-2,3-diacylglucosamine pyrophosphatase LpxH n=1 Tax=Spirochaeta isovalerica TaxID=150 RepID=A0A841RGL5_9SPIO|nr:metallophosphoesterase [Spirochaeta isovalerica]MBB6482160.1 UDP-2,3-diacylglucosamine pyrophosphatase LpxH [Spirochaeta isovalerica]
MKKSHHNQEKLEKLFNNCPSIDIDDSDKIVIFSDFHLGGRKSRDDFLPNSEMFFTILQKYYYDGGYKLILNGDVEELQKVSLTTIYRRWHDLYELFGKFRDRDGLYKIVGNHDGDLLLIKNTINFRPNDINYQILPGLKLQYKDNTIFVLHGHQASNYHGFINSLVGLSLKYIAHPLMIKNIKRPYTNVKKLKAEEKIYDFSKDKKILSLVGHTHRALFEGLSEADYLKYNIEQRIRKYLESDEHERARLESSIRVLADALKELLKTGDHYDSFSSIYDHMIIPCLFNSGCVIDRKGINCLEIENGHISLVSWYDETNRKSNITYNPVTHKRLDDTSYCRARLKKDSLDYIFTRIDLLT